MISSAAENHMVIEKKEEIESKPLAYKSYGDKKYLNLS